MVQEDDYSDLIQQQRQAIGSLLINILAGGISDETPLKPLEVERIGIPEPHLHLTSYTLGSSMDGKELSRDLLEELRIICVEKQEK